MSDRRRRIFVSLSFWFTCRETLVCRWFPLDLFWLSKADANRCASFCGIILQKGSLARVEHGEEGIAVEFGKGDAEDEMKVVIWIQQEENQVGRGKAGSQQTGRNRHLDNSGYYGILWFESCELDHEICNDGSRDHQVAKCRASEPCRRDRRNCILGFTERADGIVDSRKDATEALSDGDQDDDGYYVLGIARFN